MWDYTDKVMDHFRHPRNVGTIEHPDGKATVGSLACGDALTFMFKLGPDGRIAEAKFQTFGCASAVASSSALTEMVIGKTLDEAAKITNKDIADYLGGLPDQKMHCSVMGREALEAAIHNYRTGEENVVQVNDEIVCTCFGITENVIWDAIKINGLKTVEEITNYTKAGGACGKCKGLIQDIIDTYYKKEEQEEKTASTLSPAQKILKINNVIENQISNELRKDGGDITLVDIDGNKVMVKLRGKCSGCKNSHLTLKAFVEKTLRDTVDANIEVVEV